MRLHITKMRILVGALTLALVTSILALSAGFPGVSDVSVSREGNAIKIRAKWTQPIIVELIEPENENPSPWATIKLMLDIKAPLEIRGAMCRVCVYAMTTEGLRLQRELRAKPGRVELTLRIPRILIGRSVTSEDIIVNKTVAPGLTLPQPIGVRYKFEIEYEPVNTLIDVVYYDAKHHRWYFGSVALPLTPLDDGRRIEIKVRALGPGGRAAPRGTYVSPDQVPEPGQTKPCTRTQKLWGVDVPEEVYVKVSATSLPLPVKIPVKERTYVYVSPSQGWWRSDWEEAGNTQIKLRRCPECDGHGVHAAGLIEVTYIHTTTRYQGPTGGPLIIERVYAANGASAGSTTWHATPSGRSVSIAPGCAEHWLAYRSTTLGLGRVIVNYIVRALTGGHARGQRQLPLQRQGEGPRVLREK